VTEEGEECCSWGYQTASSVDYDHRCAVNLQYLRCRSVTCILLGTGDLTALQSGGSVVGSPQLVKRCSDELATCAVPPCENARYMRITPEPQIPRTSNSAGNVGLAGVKQGCDNRSRVSSCYTIDDIVAKYTRRAFIQFIRLAPTMNMIVLNLDADLVGVV
jgi:hypothetical protein